MGAESGGSKRVHAVDGSRPRGGEPASVVVKQGMGGGRLARCGRTSCCGRKAARFAPSERRTEVGWVRPPAGRAEP